MRRLLPVIIFISFIILNGCYAPIQLNKKQDKIDVSAKSLALTTVKISNQHKPGYQPTVIMASFDANSEGVESTQFSSFSSTLPLSADIYKSETDKYNEHLLAFSLKPGSYNFRSLSCRYHIPLLIYANCYVPINSIIEIKANSVVYLGNIDAKIRERKNSEERAGSLIPLIDQAVAGFSTGTFDVVFTDKYDEDMIKFITEYPALKTVKIDKAILPPWTRPENIKKK